MFYCCSLSYPKINWCYMYMFANIDNLSHLMIGKMCDYYNKMIMFEGLHVIRLFIILHYCLTNCVENDLRLKKKMNASRMRLLLSHMFVYIGMKCTNWRSLKDLIRPMCICRLVWAFIVCTCLKVLFILSPWGYNM